MTRPFRHCFECFHEPHYGGKCLECPCLRGKGDIRQAEPFDSKAAVESLIKRLADGTAGMNGKRPRKRWRGNGT